VVRKLLRNGGPLALGVLGVAVLGLLLVAGPAQSYLDARERVEILALKDRALEQENTRLEQRMADLHDPVHLELVAREQLGLVRPGEIAYTIIPPEELIELLGQIVKGKVVRLEEYGAFVEVTPRTARVTGLVHVSEVDADYVENIYAYLAEGDEVDVKVLDVKEDGKVDLSIKRADPEWQDEEVPNLRSKLDKDFNKRLRRFMHKSQMIQGEARRQKRGRIGT
jgi:predicted RNA-binding protein with RPS1 domain/cell division protein FtsB